MKTRMIAALFVCSVLITALPAGTSCAEGKDACKEQGIIVRNATMLDLWYTKDNGQCTIWIHEHLVSFKPGESLRIFSGMDCKALYCANNPVYKDYKAIDKNGDCRVRILPDCRLSDM